MILGYGLAYWQFSRGDHFQAAAESEQVQALVAQLVLAERQLQIERAAQSNAAKEMAGLQDQMMRLKEDVAFYKGILEESGSSGVTKLHSVKLAKGSRPGEYQYHIVLVQSGRHDKVVQGTLRLLLQATQAGKAITRNVEVAGEQKGNMVSFKYFHRIDGSFHVPSPLQGQSLMVEFSESGGKRSKLTQVVKLPD